MVIQMVKDAIKTGFEPTYVLFDSSFMCDIFMSEIQKLKIRNVKKLLVIGLMKTDRCIMINGKIRWQICCRIISEKTSDFAKKHKCNYLAIRMEYKGIKVKAFWVKTNGS